MRRIPAFVWIGSVIMIVLVLILLAGGWLLAKQTRADCNRAVMARNDNRAMWLYLVDQNPDDPNVPAFVAELDKRLPVLRCENGTLVVAGRE